MAALSEEQILLQDSARAWARERSPIEALRKLRDAPAPLGYDPAVFAEMAALGWAGILVPERYGGAAFGHRSMGVVLEALGRTLVASPLVASSVGAVEALRAAGTEAQKQAWLPRIAAGEAVVTLAVDEGARHDPGAIALRAEKKGSKYLLTGEKRPVPHGLAAAAAIVAARTGAGVTLFLVETSAPKLEREELIEIERRGAAVYRFGAVALEGGAVLGAVDRGAPVLERALDCARAGLAAEMLGSAQSAFDITLAYLKTRVQFGRPIGAFQALQHRAAALLGELELTRSAVEAALDALDAGAADAAEQVSVAKALAGDTFRQAAGEMIQMHGGIGMTDEHDAGLFLKRARIADMAFGAAGFHRERFARLAGY